MAAGESGKPWHCPRVCSSARPATKLRVGRSQRSSLSGARPDGFAYTDSRESPNSFGTAYIAPAHEQALISASRYDLGIEVEIAARCCLPAARATWTVGACLFVRLVVAPYRQQTLRNLSHDTGL